MNIHQVRVGLTLSPKYDLMQTDMFFPFLGEFGLNEENVRALAQFYLLSRK